MIPGCETHQLPIAPKPAGVEREAVAKLLGKIIVGTV